MESSRPTVVPFSSGSERVRVSLVQANHSHIVVRPCVRFFLVYRDVNVRIIIGPVDFEYLRHRNNKTGVGLNNLEKMDDESREKSKGLG